MVVLEQERLVFEAIDSALMDEERIITHKWLAYHVDVSVAHSQFYLEKYFTQSTRQDIHACYVLWRKGETSIDITLAYEAEIEDLIQQGYQLRHLYSLQRSESQDSQALLIADYNLLSVQLDKQFSYSALKTANQRIPIGTGKLNGNEVTIDKDHPKIETVCSKPDIETVCSKPDSTRGILIPSKTNKDQLSSSTRLSASNISSTSKVSAESINIAHKQQKSLNATQAKSSLSQFVHSKPTETKLDSGKGQRKRLVVESSDSEDEVVTNVDGMGGRATKRQRMLEKKAEAVHSTSELVVDALTTHTPAPSVCRDKHSPMLHNDDCLLATDSSPPPGPAVKVEPTEHVSSNAAASQKLLHDAEPTTKPPVVERTYMDDEGYLVTEKSSRRKVLGETGQTNVEGHKSQAAGDDELTPTAGARPEPQPCSSGSKIDSSAKAKSPAPAGNRPSKKTQSSLFSYFKAVNNAN